MKRKRKTFIDEICIIFFGKNILLGIFRREQRNVYQTQVKKKIFLESRFSAKRAEKTRNFENSVFGRERNGFQKNDVTTNLKNNNKMRVQPHYREETGEIRKYQKQDQEKT